MTTAEYKDWIREHADAEAENHASASGSRRADRKARKRIRAKVQADFKETFGFSWLTILVWIPTIIQIVNAILNAKFGKVSDTDPE